MQLEVDADPHGIALNLARTPAREEDFVWLLEVLPTCYVLNSPQARFDTFEQALDAGPVAVMAGTPRALELEAVRRVSSAWSRSRPGTGGADAQERAGGGLV